MSQPPIHQGDAQQSQPAAVPSLVLPLLALTFVLLVLIIGGGLVYVTLMHPSVAVPLTVAAAGLTVVFTVASVLVALVVVQRR